MITVNSGGRLPVSFGPYTGIAGVVDTLVAFPASIKALQGVENGTIDGREVDVVSVEAGSIDGFVRLKVKER